MERTTDDIITEVVTERIDQILLKKRKSELSSREERGRILKELDDDMRHQFEEFAGTLFTECAEDYLIIYRMAFADGLRLAHKIF